MKNSAYQVYSGSSCPYVQRVTILLEEKNIPYTHQTIDLQNKPDWFLKISPLGKVPLLQIDGDKVLFESQVINDYLDEIETPHMSPTDAFQRAQNRAWIALVSNAISSFGGYYYATDEATMNARLQTVGEQLVHLEKAVSDGPFFNGDEFSLVDAAAAPLFSRFEFLEAFHKVGVLRDFPRLRAWSSVLLEHPSVKAVTTDEIQQIFLHTLHDKETFIAQYGRVGSVKSCA
jgi:glutathione S-transferase